jgi:hypothetical protein
MLAFPARFAAQGDLEHRHAAIHVNRGSRDIGGLVGGEVDGRRRDLLGRAESLRRL